MPTGLPPPTAITAGAQTAARSPASKLATLAIDIGGTGLKALVLSPDGTAQTERVRVPTPKPATPTAVLDALGALVEPLEFDRVSGGFPGVVVDGVTKTAPNLDPSWTDFDLAGELGRRLHRTVRVLNGAGVQGFGVGRGRGGGGGRARGAGRGGARDRDGGD